MIIDLLENMGGYPQLRSVHAYLSEHDLSALAPGSYAVGENVTLNVNEYFPSETDNIVYEKHEKYIDCQIVAEGKEYIFVHKPEGADQTADYDEQGDFSLFKAPEGDKILLTRGYFAVFFPQDLHAPGKTAGDPSRVRKYVFKVRV